MKNVFILGAGASCLAGGPLMNDFLDQADRLKRERDEGVADAIDAFEDVSDAITHLRGIYAKSQLDLNNLETLFSTIEMGRLIGKFPGRDINGIEQLRKSLITLIFKTLEANMKFPVTDGHVNPPRPYPQFAELLRNARQIGNWQHYSSCAVITFNYDLALDYALHHHGIPFDYCLTGESAIGSLPLLKLHGSINWGVCQKCGAIDPFQPKDAKFGSLWPETKSIRYNLGSLLPTRQHCELPLLSEPLIVPPTWDKTAYHSQLGQVWREACRQLEQAEIIFVMGYSLPQTDNFFKYLWALGSEGTTAIRRFWVQNPDAGVDPRFKELIGRGIENRYEYRSLEFQDAVQQRRLLDALSEA